MTELKTLKDLAKKYEGYIIIEDHQKHFYEEIRQEAIKRLHHYYNLLITFEGSLEEIGMIKGHIQEIRMFFNITEEELK